MTSRPAHGDLGRSEAHRAGLPTFTPKRALRAYCLQCCAGIQSGVNSPKGCNAPQCPAHPYRTGRTQPGHPRPSAKACRRVCLWCMCGNAAEVRRCGETGCAMHLYRMGKNPVVASAQREINPQGPPASPRGTAIEAERRQNRRKAPKPTQDTFETSSIRGRAETPPPTPSEMLPAVTRNTATDGRTR